MVYPKTAIVLDKRHTKKDGSITLKLRITFKGKQEYYTLPYSMTTEDFNRVMKIGKKLSDSEKQLKKKIESYETKAKVIIDKLQNNFSFDSFNRNFLSDKTFNGTLLESYDNYIKDLKSEGREGTASSYECSRNSIFNFKKNADFNDITISFLKSYEKWMLSEGRQIATIGIYLRPLRALLNKAILEGKMDKELYPFGRRKYEIPTGRNIKKALSKTDLKNISNYKLESGSAKERARDFWMFLFLCNGMNVKDMCLLKYENIENDMCQFIRAKTKNTKREAKEIRFQITPKINEIINKWGDKNRKPKNYVFPILEKEMTSKRERQLIQQLTHVINDHTKEIGEKLGIKKLTTYSARHSFATILQRSDISIGKISEAMGHSNENITKGYLAGFGDDTRIEIANAISSSLN